MSRGPGWTERAITAYFEANPSTAFSTEDLIRGVYQIAVPEKKHRVAILHAANKVLKRMPWWAKWRCERQFALPEGRDTIFVNLTDLRSYAMGRLRVDFVHAHKSITKIEAMLGDEEHIKLMARGGAWWCHVQVARKKLLGAELEDGDQALLDAFDAKTKKFEATTLKAFAPVSQAQDRRRWRRDQDPRGHLCEKCGNPIEPAAPVVRKRVVTQRLAGRNSTIEMQCLDCGSPGGWPHWQRNKCATCGREIHELNRSDRRRTFCSDDCRRQSKGK
jgi:hypothetical protein